MKAERRHELRENDLLHALVLLRDYVNEHSGRITFGLVGVIVVVGAITIGLRSRSAAHEDLWRRKGQLAFTDVETGRQSLKALRTLTEESGDLAFTLSSLLDQGRHALRLAKEVPFPPDLEMNEQARHAFKEMRRRFPGNPMAIGVALLGLATAEENDFAFDEDPVHKERARAYLQAVVEDAQLNGMPFQQMALDRLQSLDKTFQVVVHAPMVVPTADPEIALDAPVDGSDEDVDESTADGFEE